MDNFLKNSFKALLPITLCFCLIYVFGNYSSDYYFHLAYQGDGTYPPFLSWLLQFSGTQPRSWALFEWNIFFTTLLPYCLISKIKNQDAGWVYLYSGIPLVLFTIWLIPQSIIQVLMLLAILNPLVGFTALLLFGWSIHQFWWAGCVLVLFYHAYKYMKKGYKFDENGGVDLIDYLLLRSKTWA